MSSGSDAVAASYEERFLAFIDVLGFADLVSRSSKSAEIVEQLSRTMSMLSDLASSARSEELGIETTSFSDTIVISSPLSSDALIRLLEIVEEISFELFSSNMLLRGAVVRGMVLHTPKFVFGPALVSAYRLETSTSFHPRIMIDPGVHAAIEAFPDRSRFGRFLVVDSYDVPYINPFSRWEGTESPSPAAQAQLVQLQGIIAAGLMAGASNPSVGEKYKWLGRKLNRFIRSRGGLADIQQLDIE